MRVLKNLLGDGSKIHAGEIQVSKLLNLMDSVIVEEGSNDDGSYIRFGNGWQVCWKRASIVADVNNSTGSTRLSNDLRWEYPVHFIDEAYADVSVVNGYSPTPFWQNVRVVGRETLTYRIVTVWTSGFTSVGFITNFIAIGK